MGLIHTQSVFIAFNVSFVFVCTQLFDNPTASVSQNTRETICVIKLMTGTKCRSSGALKGPPHIQISGNKVTREGALWNTAYRIERMEGMYMYRRLLLYKKIYEWIWRPNQEEKLLNENRTLFVVIIYNSIRCVDLFTFICTLAMRNLLLQTYICIW